MAASPIHNRMHTRIAPAAEEAGYTLVELVVGLLVTLVLGSVLFAVHLSTTKHVEPWRREVTLETYAHLITQRLAADVAHAEQLFDEGNGRWRLTYRSGRRLIYRLDAGTLTRDGAAMHPPTLDVASLQLEPSHAETHYARPRRAAPLDDARSLMHVRLHLAVASRERTLEIVTTAALRQPRPWRPLR